MRYTVVYDACVLYPAPLRDLLMRLATTDLFSAKWTDRIHDEWTRSLLKNRPELNETVPRTRELMNKAVPDCLVTGYENLIPGLDLRDKDDQHVLAAAIRCHAQAIITVNLKDFPVDALETYDIEALHPDRFIQLQFEQHEGAVIKAVKQQRASLKNPPKETDEFLELLAAQGLVVTVDLLREFQDLL